MLDLISLSGLSFESVIGVYPSERAERQTIVLDIALGLDTRPAVGGDIERTVDYARLGGELKFLMHACRFALLETAAEALCRYMLTAVEARAQVQEATVWLKKPKAQATLQVRRTAKEYKRRRTAVRFGAIEPVFLARELGIYRVHIKPKSRWRGRAQDAQHLALGSELELQARPIGAGTAMFLPSGFVFEYQNRSTRTQTVLVVERPQLVASQLVGTEARGELHKPPPGVAYYPAEHALPHQA